MRDKFIAFIEAKETRIIIGFSILVLIWIALTNK